MAAFLRRAAVPLVLAALLACATVGRAFDIEDLPIVDCANANLPYCVECRSFTAPGANPFYFCSACEEGYTPGSAGANLGRCMVYDGDCDVPQCTKCAADDPSRCVQCDTGVPDQNTYQCYGSTLGPTSTTTAPTTPAPTTPAPTTPAPTTPAPTTPAPTTAAPTTAAPTTAAPTTAAPTTAAPTTAAPTTAAPTTAAPTTAAPTTAAPTTAAPTTAAPTTAAPTTAAPTTPAPTTAAPTTPAPTTAEPTTTSVPCQVAGCATCSTMPNICAVCSPGLVSTDTGLCMQVGACTVSHCAQCYADSFQKCSTCNRGYILTTGHQCHRNTKNGAAAPMSAMVTLSATAAVLLAYVL